MPATVNTKMRKSILFLTVYFALNIFCLKAEAAIIRVPLDYPTIQSAVGVAKAADTVLVSSGTYYGQIIMKSGVTLKSEAGPAVTILDGQGADILYADYRYDARGFKIDGFSIINGRNGLLAKSTNDITVVNNIIKNNSEYGICVETVSTITVINNIISNNTLYGIRAYTFWGAGKIVNNIIKNNSNGGIWIDGWGSAAALEVANNVIYGNLWNGAGVPDGGGLYICNVNPGIRNNIIFNNRGQFAGVRGYNSGMSLEYNDVWNNTAYNVQNGNPNYYSCPPAIASISADPLFVDLSGNNYHLILDSPCVNAGNPGSQYNDLNGTRNDLGYHGGPYALAEQEPTEYFAQRSGTQLLVNGKQFYFNGSNNDHLYHWSHFMIGDVLSDAKDLGLTVFRAWASSEGQDSLANHGYCFQPNLGQYHEPTFQQMDYIIAKAKEKGIRLILPLVNNWDDGYGGMPQYVRWCVGDPGDWSGKSTLTFDLYNEGDAVTADVALKTGTQWVWHESLPITLKPGWNYNLSVDLTASTWKTQASGWLYIGPVRNLNQLRSLDIGVFGYSHPGAVYIDNIRLDAALYDGLEKKDNWSAMDSSYATGIDLSTAYVSEGSHSLKMTYSYSYGEYNKAFAERQPQPEKNLFYTNTLCKERYKDYIRYFLNRVNTYTGKAYKDDPTILMWELANEPRCESDPSGDTLQAWIDDIAGYIKFLDPNHLVSIGAEGWYRTPGNSDWKYDGRLGADYLRNHQSQYVDICSFHLYPEGYGLSDQDSLVWIQQHVDDARNTLEKPVYLGEFGITADRRATVLNDFDSDTQNWSIDWNYTQGPVHVESPSYDGNGAIRYIADINGTHSSCAGRIIYPSTGVDYSGCDYLSGWVYLPASAPADLTAEMYVRSGDSWKWTNGRNQPLVPGSWVRVELSRSWIENGGGDTRKIRDLGIQIKRGNTDYSGEVYYDLMGINMRGLSDAAIQMTRRNQLYTDWFNLLYTRDANGAGFWQLLARQDDGSLYPDYWNWGVYYPEDAVTSLVIQDFSEKMKKGGSDPIPPTIPQVTDEGAYTSRKDQLYASWSSSDPVSGISEYKYKITQDSSLGTVVRDWTSTGTYNNVTAGALSLQEGKAYYFAVKAKNGAGTESQPGYSDGITVDSLSPLTIDSGVDGSWHNSPVTVTLYASDAGSGVDKTYYSIDSSNPTIVYSGPFTISTEGTYTIQYYSLDKAGNKEPVKTAVNQVKFDKTSPSIPGTPVLYAGTNPSNTGTYTISWAVSTDNQSGISGYDVYRNGTKVNQVSTNTSPETNLGEGSYTYVIYARDNAGNISNASPPSAAIVVSKTAPTVGITINHDAGYTNSTLVVLNLFASVIGGSSPSQMQFSNDNISYSNPEPYAAFKFWALTPSNGTKTVYGKFADQAGNWSGAYSDTIILDTLFPGITNISTSPAPFDPESGQSLKISYTLSDNLSTSLFISGSIYTATGSLVKDLSALSQALGDNYIYWDGKNSLGAYVPDGTYRCIILVQDQAGNYTFVSQYLSKK